jgi:hypothetical protein
VATGSLFQKGGVAMMKRVALMTLLLFLLSAAGLVYAVDENPASPVTNKADFTRAEKLSQIALNILRNKKTDLPSAIVGAKIGMAGANLRSWLNKPRLQNGGDLFALAEEYRRICDKIIASPKNEEISSLLAELSQAEKPITDALKPDDLKNIVK